VLTMKQNKLFRCVYCLKNKPRQDFNKEHVSPQAFGTYENNMTLHKRQVCRECNSVFSTDLETELAKDSLEALLRRTSGMDKKNKIGDTRIKLIGRDGVTKGLGFRVFIDNANTEKIRLEPYPAVGILVSENLSEYKY